MRRMPVFAVNRLNKGLNRLHDGSVACQPSRHGTATISYEPAVKKNDPMTNQCRLLKVRRHVGIG